ncbi:MAG: PEP-CTERM sorting domain-containing protein [Sedimentisphaerales bacterium]
MMKNPKIILSCLICIMLATSASAAWVSLTDVFPLSSLQGESLIFGDKEISEFTLSGIADGGALPPNPATMTVQGGQDSITGDYGLKFNFSWNAGPGQTVNATLDFKVSVRDGYDDYFIKDVTLDITGASADGNGVVNVGEDVRDVSNNPLVLLSCSAWQDSPAALLIDYAEFAPLKAIWIHSKDVSITGGVSGSAHISEFYQYYSQVPEPATLVLLGTASIWIFARKKRSV